MCARHLRARLATVLATGDSWRSLPPCWLLAIALAEAVCSSEPVVLELVTAPAPSMLLLSSLSPDRDGDGGGVVTPPIMSVFRIMSSWFTTTPRISDTCRIAN